MPPLGLESVVPVWWTSVTRRPAYVVWKMESLTETQGEIRISRMINWKKETQGEIRISHIINWNTGAYNKGERIPGIQLPQIHVLFSKRYFVLCTETDYCID